MQFMIPKTPIEKLHTQLEDQAVGDRAPTVHYRTLDTAIGRLLLAATALGLVRIAFENEDQDAVLDSLAAQISPQILRMPRPLDAAAHWLDAYLAGATIAYTLPLDRQLTRGYRREVLTELSQVGYGQQISYAHLAARTSSPRAVRAVGSACATNPLPLVVPCHRVIRTDGRLGAYRGGAALKKRLLALEETSGLA